MTVPQEVRLARHAGDLDPDGHDIHGAVAGAYTVEPQTPHQARLYLMRDGTWRDPFVSGLGTVTPGGGATITNDTKYNAWPTVARLTEDRLIVAYTRADSHHADNTGIAVVKIGTEADDGTVTWGDVITAHFSQTLWVSAFGVSRISTGRIFLGLWRDDHAVSGSGEAGITYSDDDGATWTDWIDLTNGFTQEAYTAGPVCEMPNGDLLITIEGSDSGDPVANRSSHTLRSIDGGLTWGDEVTIRDYDTRPYYETRLVLLDDDTLLAVHRTSDGSPGTHYISTSTDFGFTWSAPAAAFDGYGSGSVIQMSTGTLVATTRQNATGDVILFTSIDRGATWDSGTVLVTTTEMEYGQAIELLNGRGELLVVYGDQPSGSTTNADIKTIRVTEDVSATGGGPDLSAIDFLVGTASGDLSAEIAVGTTPGGQLAGTASTWPSPVVTNSHGSTPSTHAATQAAAEATAAAALAAALAALGPSHVHVAYETHTADGSTTTFTLDQVYDPGSVMAWNRTTGHVLGVTEVAPDQATISAAGTAADLIDFHYAASVI